MTTMTTRTQLEAGGVPNNHNETMRRATDSPTISMRRQPRITSHKDDRLALLVVRAGLRAGLARLARKRE
jgi:hypothetical protein